MNREKLGAYIKGQRARQGITQKELADRVNQSLSYVYDIEAGKRASLSPARFFEWAAALNADPKEFYEAAEEPYPIEERPHRVIELPYDLPLKSQEQIEQFVKFVQYQKEFEEFLKLYDPQRLEAAGSGSGGAEGEGESRRLSVEEFVRDLIEKESKNRKQVS